MADVTDTKSVGGNTVWVQVPLPAPKKNKSTSGWLVLFSVQIVTQNPRCSREKSPKKKSVGGLSSAFPEFAKQTDVCRQGKRGKERRKL